MRTPRPRSCLLLAVPFALIAAAAAAAAVAATAPPARTGIHYVYLVRHGIYDRDTTSDEVRGNGLNALGHEQARLIGARLAALPVRPASLVTSPLRRARETAEDMGTVMKMTPARDSLIEECTPTTERADYLARYTPAEIARCDSNLAAAWRRYMTATPDADRHDVLVCHGNVIRWFVARVLMGDSRRWHLMEIANASLTILAVRPDGTSRLVSFSDVGHLPVARQTWTGKGAGWSAPASR
jgi:serine/threonine-protein phosphatase PGAM5